MGTTLRAAAAAAVLLLAAGCSDNGPSPRDPTSTWSPTGKMETPTSAAPDPVEPELPAAAAEASEVGARAFIEYYWELVNYAQVTGDVKALKKVSGPNCERCDAGIDGIKQVYRAGGHITDGQYTPSLTSVTQLTADDRNFYAFEAKTQVSNVAHAAVEASGRREEFAASTKSYVVDVLWVEDHWRLDVMQVV
ncbi:DUF6318 family protein [Nocardioides sp. SLBN-35]|uniref:DUF6318 family protein n=1 Tax=Nocardioides sp. SLBN-35 TaxID=2768445 RepID=UPI001151752D|nr:DUF6318 family protein [Nocardioides sp. SLBN-35]TQK70753.1 hypothetical protein FBY23_2534 [Nocardioides sp. SLBN-35]